MSALSSDLHGTATAIGAPVSEYDIDSAIVKWMQDERIQRRLEGVRITGGGWEVWAECELEVAFVDEFQLWDSHIRRNSNVFNESPANREAEVDDDEEPVDEKEFLVDFLLPQTEQSKGMVIKLKCEERRSMREEMEELVQRNMDKASTVKVEYKEYTFVALAMAYTDEAHECLTRMGMEPIAQAVHVAPDGSTLRVYRKNMLTTQ